ncbi:MAG: hypothetical protein GTO55_09900, partial [Armatimonadetes bacterium]|nr:hypothetical protein [Armatimonadota bacterium]NIM24556.1 hypothetical protein [Armatimonadota bacterium]NIM68430.1 hypothetical protein [Armatimonadota bacterium]NIM76816.1 hypothetical protein [Armatimonadota bacterium]NIN06629.1 hypothetical protein [Armatimonadota bacterium]
MIRAKACFSRRTSLAGSIWIAIALVSLLSVIAVSDCRAAAKKETAKTPPLTQAAGGPVLIGTVRGSEIRLAGVWQPKTGWRSAANADEDKELMPDGTVWTLYSLDERQQAVFNVVSGVVPPVKATSGPPHIKPRYDPVHMKNRAEDFCVSAELGSPPEGEYPLAVSGVDFIDERPVRVLPRGVDYITNQVCEYLVEEGPFKRPKRIHQVLRADLDGDDEEEHLVTVRGHAPAYYEPEDRIIVCSNYAIAAAHRKQSGGYAISVLTQTSQDILRGAYGSGVEHAEILAIADINGDGRREVAISTKGSDWWAFEVYAFDGSQFRQVLFFGGPG